MMFRHDVPTQVLAQMMRLSGSVSATLLSVKAKNRVIYKKYSQKFLFVAMYKLGSK
jgi:hypothetical protein